MPLWTAPFHLLADLILPAACPVCDSPLPGDERFCEVCTQRILVEVGRDYCPRCGKTAEPYLTRANGCPECRETRQPVAGVVRVGTYAGAVGDIIRRFKYEREQRLDDVLGSLLADAMRRREWCEQLDALVPVPTNWSGWWNYKFHPAGLIARRTSKHLGVPQLPLVRIAKKRRPQKGLSLTERFLNIRGAFRMARKAAVKGATLCVIDDVSTSGATLQEMGRVLKAAGAARVFAAVAVKTGYDVTDPNVATVSVSAMVKR